MPSVYLETTIIGYLASRPSGDLITAANQQLTKDWWNSHREHYNLYVSQVVIDECTAGDSIAAQKRLSFLVDISRLDVSGEAEHLAERIVTEGPLPAKAKVDALHIAVATVHGLDYLLTWNCAHIANAAWRHTIEQICRSAGFEPPTICTPQELMEL
jgi:hypothetical protein